ncbi:MAG: ATP-dependent DNA helicase [Promicromonosporaceae bacterium]|nr:ATP-dependent DNA helicase [Promicromonosporaceae bacterium]
MNDATDIHDDDDDAAASGSDPDTTLKLLNRAVELLGGEPRAGQTEMAQAVAQAIATETALLVQAGTGTGKTLGYLAPAAVHATSGGTAIVATATLTLQRQLVTRDLPLIERAAQGILTRAPKFAILKGRGNYLCRYKASGGFADDDELSLFEAAAASPDGTAESVGSAPSAESSIPQPRDPLLRGGAANISRAESSIPGGVNRPTKRTSRTKSRNAASDQKTLAAEVKRLIAWGETTDTGDRDDLVPGVSDRAWRQVSIAGLECFGAKCPFFNECFSELAREAARQADIVITNHAMLAVAASGSPGVLPEHDVLVVDEAHDLASAITNGATTELSLPAINRVARLGRRQGFPSRDLEDAATAFGTALALAPAGRFEEGLPPELLDAIVIVRDLARKLTSALKPDTTAEIDGPAKIAQSAALQLFETADRFAAALSGDVVWSTQNDDGHARLYLAPRDVGPLIRDLTEETAAIFTSATLKLGGKFDAVAHHLGLAAGEYEAIDVGSPFEYHRQGILYIAGHLQTPSRESAIETQLDEIEALMRAAGGRTLGLFSSRRAAGVAAEAMRERLGLPVLLQGEDQLPTQLAEFLATGSGDNTHNTGALIVGEGAELYREDLEGAVASSSSFEPLLPSASVLGRIAQRKVRAGIPQPTAPQYLRRPDIHGQ